MTAIGHGKLQGEKGRISFLQGYRIFPGRPSGGERDAVVYRGLRDTREKRTP